MPYSSKIKNGEWKQEWLDMPEFEQEDLSPYRTIFIHFRNDEDVRAFERLLGQTITEKKKYYWFPEKITKSSKNKRYIDDTENIQ